jgi:hypothetical protein
VGWIKGCGNEFTTGYVSKCVNKRVAARSQALGLLIASQSKQQMLVGESEGLMEVRKLMVASVTSW